MKKILILIFLFILGITTYLGLNKKFSSKPKKVEVYRVKRERIETTILCTGKVKPKKKTIVRAEGGGRIKKVMVKEGETVKPNQVLLIFDKEEEKMNLILAENRFKMAEIELKEAAETLRKTEILYKASATSGLTLNEASARYEKAVVGRDDAKDKVRLAKMILDRMKCTPFHKGKVIEVKVEDGQMVERGQELFVIASLSPLYIEAEVDEIDAISVACGQKVVITHEAFQDREFTGEVIKIKEKVEEKPPTRVLGVIIGLKEKDVPLKIEMEVDVKIIIGYKDGLFVPLKAIREDEKGVFVFTIKNGIAYKKRIKTGISTVDKVEVWGLLENEEVITSLGIKAHDKVLR